MRRTASSEGRKAVISGGSAGFLTVSRRGSVDGLSAGFGVFWAGARARLLRRTGVGGGLSFRLDAGAVLDFF